MPKHCSYAKLHDTVLLDREEDSLRKHGITERADIEKHWDMRYPHARRDIGRDVILDELEKRLDKPVPICDNSNVEAAQCSLDL